VSVGTGVGVGEGVEVGVGVGVDVGVGVWVGVGEGVSVGIAVGEGVCVGISVGVNVGMSVGIGLETTALMANPAAKRPATTAIPIVSLERDDMYSLCGRPERAASQGRSVPQDGVSGKANHFRATLTRKVPGVCQAC
jgi:hypothetical protein